jgi:hypothetical protein
VFLKNTENGTNCNCYNFKHYKSDFLYTININMMHNILSFNEIADKLNKITVPQQGSGLGVRSAYEKISPEFDLTILSIK